jgi:RNA polymerase sigma-70 factor, ECF subfamily
MDLLEREAEAALVIRLQARDESALAELYERLGAKVFTLAINMLNSHEEAEEVLQDTFLKLYRNASSFSVEGGSARAYLYAIARNECLSRLRAKRSRPNKADSYDLHDPNTTFTNFNTPNLSTQPSDTVTNVMLEQALDQLEETDQKLVKGAFFDGYSHAELAANSGLPLGTVKSRVRRALLTLRSFLEKP